MYICTYVLVLLAYVRLNVWYHVQCIAPKPLLCLDDSIGSADV